jgi:hypothetical protein
MLMSSRLRVFSSFCLFTVLVSVQLSAQSNRASHGAGAFKSTAQFSNLLPPSGPTFATPNIFNSGGNGPNSVAIADVNGDNIPDLVVANWCTDATCTASSVAVLLGNGDGTFKTAVAYGSGGLIADSVAVAQLRGTGHPLDIVVANCGANSNSNCISTANSGNVAVLLGNGDGTFVAAVTYPLGTLGASSVAVADVNGDNIPDLVVASGSMAGGFVGVLTGKGDGTFNAEVTYGSGGVSPLAVAIADVNGDNKPDVVVGNQCTDNTCTSSTVGVLIGNGDGTFQTVVAYDSGGLFADGVAIADVNGDSKLDLIVANSSTSLTVDNGNVGVLLGKGDGTFNTAATYPSGAFGAASVAVADVNGDGNLDVVVVNCSSTSSSCTGGGGLTVGVGVLLGKGDGSFQTAVTFDSGGSAPFGVAVADVNGDSKPDIVAANCAGASCGAAGAGTVGVLLNTITPGGTKTKLTSLPNPSNFGQSVTFTATVTSGFTGTPTGTVNFSDGATKIGVSNLNGSGVATLTTSSLVAGTHGITATYSGDSNFATSTSPVLQQLVQGAVVSLSPSVNFGNQTVKVASTPQVVTLKNTGNINLTITSIQITGANSGDFAQKNNCPASLAANASCQVDVTFTPTATGTLNAAVSVADNAPGTPQSVSLTGVGVAALVPDYTLSANPTSATVAPGSSANYVITLKPSNGYDGTVTINCPSGLPPGVSCNNPSIGPGATQATLTVKTSGPSAALTAAPDGNPHQGASTLWASLGGLGLVGMILAGDWKKRNRRGMGIMLTILAVAMILALVGCGGSSSSASGGGGGGGGGGTPAGTYKLQISATGTAGTNGGNTAPHPLPLTLIVN